MVRKMQIVGYLIVFAIVVDFMISGCHKEIFTEDPGKTLRIEDDTLSFDTVFTTVGSATRYLKIYNDHDQSIEIKKVYVASGNQSDFKINVDGLHGNLVEHIEIGAHDSIYLFCEVTVNPDDPVAISPFVKSDSIILEYNGVKQQIVLLAFGQNANYFPSKLNKGQVTTVDLQGSTLIWNDPKPYIIYGIVYFENGTLIIPEASKIYVWGGLTKARDNDGNTFFYNDGRIIIGSNATLKVTGTLNNPVVFQGVRLESQFQNTPGQWSGIYFDKMSQGNEINYAVIKNNLIGIIADSMSVCKISETKIYNNTLYGIYASTATLELDNCLLFNQGSSGLVVSTGGNYEFNYCTIVNSGNTDPAVSLSNSRCIDFPFCEVIYESPLNALIRNCIITGTDEDELSMFAKPSSAFEPYFQNCLLHIKELYKDFPDFKTKYTMDCIYHSGVFDLFEDINNDNYHPDTLSVLEAKAIPVAKIPLDLDGTLRDMVTPDIGCYEYK